MAADQDERERLARLEVLAKRQELARQVSQQLRRLEWNARELTDAIDAVRKCRQG